MNITGFKVSFRRSKQPASYESAEPLVELTGAFAEDETNQEALVREAMAIAVTTVYNTLAMDVPEAIVAKLGATPEPAKQPAKPAKAKAKPAAAEAAPAAEPEPEPEAAEDIDDAALMKRTNAATKSIGASGVKAILAEMKVARVGEMDQKQRRDYFARLEVAEGDTK